MAGVVYVVRNPSFPDLIKIGFTTNLEKRIRDLSAPSGIPERFECVLAYEMKNAKEVEAALKVVFGDRRPQKSREFFTVSPERVRAILELLPSKEVTPAQSSTSDPSNSAKSRDTSGKGTVRTRVMSVQKTSSKAEKPSGKAPVFRFPMVGIKEGAELRFLGDEKIRCTVRGERNVVLEGKEVSLNQATLEVLRRKGKKWKACRGANHWTYKDKTLSERRAEIEDID